jgi:hypothetical protein
MPGVIGFMADEGACTEANVPGVAGKVPGTPAMGAYEVFAFLASGSDFTKSLARFPDFLSRGVGAVSVSLLFVSSSVSASSPASAASFERDTNLPLTRGLVSASRFLQSYLICFLYIRFIFFVRKRRMRDARSSFV